MDFILDIFNQINLQAIWGLIQSGFILGALAGLIVGVSMWTMMESGSTSTIRIMIGAVIGLVVGLIFEGSGIFALFSQGLDSIFGSSGGVRLDIFDSVIILFTYMFCFMGLGAFISNPFRAMSGMLLGIFLGTIAGMIFFLGAPAMNLPLQSTILQALIAILVLIFMGFMSLSESNG